LETLGRDVVQALQQMADEADFGEIDFGVKRDQDGGGTHETVVAARMHRIEAVREQMCAGHLQHPHLGLACDVLDAGIAGQRINRGVDHAQIDAALPERRLDQHGKGACDEFPVSLRPAEKGDIGLRQITRRSAKIES